MSGSLDRLTALARQVEEMRGALEKIDKGGPPVGLRHKTYQCGFDTGCEWAGNIARAALSTQKTGGEG